jgi:hypothetical protein
MNLSLGVSSMVEWSGSEVTPTLRARAEDERETNEHPRPVQAPPCVHPAEQRRQLSKFHP